MEKINFSYCDDEYTVYGGSLLIGEVVSADPENNIYRWVSNPSISEMYKNEEAISPGTEDSKKVESAINKFLEKGKEIESNVSGDYYFPNINMKRL